MVLPYEYFKNQSHIKDLQKLKDQELYFIISLFYKELEYFNQSKEFKIKGLIIVCNETKELIKEFRFILNNYINVINENDLSFCSIKDINIILSKIDKIENYLNMIKNTRYLKTRVNELVDGCLLYIRILYDLLNDFLFMETHLWESRFNLRK